MKLFKRNYPLVKHTPMERITEEEKGYILQHGLVHYFSEEYLETIQKNGLKIEWSKPIKRAERNLLWFFINDKKGNDVGLKEFLSKKAEHRTSDINRVCKCVWYPNETEIDNMRFRPCGRAGLLFYTYNAPAIVYGSDIAPENMEISKVV